MALNLNASSVINVLRFIARKPSRAPVLADKIAKRLRGETDAGSVENDAWLAEHSTSAEAVTLRLAPQLWEEATRFDADLREHARSVLGKIPYDLGGGGDHRFLYWLTRYLEPQVIVETGVAAGWSSRAFLTALKKNGSGRLYSSDLPYFRLPDPDRFVGVLVESDLRENWTLLLEGDQANLPRILDQVQRVDIFHYDSDKMASGRGFAVALVRDKLARGGVMVMDDIFNDDWFRNYVTVNRLPFTVVEHRYGIIGSLERAATSRQTSA